MMMIDRAKKPPVQDTTKELYHDDHPANRPIESDDPMAMTAESAPGDPELMLTILVEEFASIGMNSEEINRLFDDSFYGATGLLKRKLGEGRVRSRITEIVRHCGILRETVTV